MKRFFAILSIVLVSGFAAACSDEKKDEAATYKLSFNLTSGSDTTAVEISGSRVFGGGSTSFNGMWNRRASANTAEMYWTVSGDTLPQTYECTSSAAGFYYTDESGVIWSSYGTSTFTITVTQTTPTVKGTFSGILKKNNTSSTLVTVSDGVFEGDYW